MFPPVRHARPLIIVLATFVVALPTTASALAAPSCTISGTSGADTLRGTPGDDVLCGLGGDDTIVAGGGDDVVVGGSGTDTVSYGRAAGGVNVNLATGRATGEGVDTLSGVENVIASAYSDELNGNSAANTLSGGGGADTLSGSGGNDRLDGGTGTDTVSYAQTGPGVRIDLAADTASGQGTDAVVAIENVTGSPKDDVVTGDAGPNTLSGGGGADTLTGAAGNDVLDGGVGLDTVAYASSTAVSVDLAAGTASGQGTDKLTSAENATGSPQADTLIGSAVANVLDGGPGNDRLDGAGGTDTASYTAAPSAVTVDLGAGRATGNGSDTIDGFENAIGSRNVDTLMGDRGRNILSGGAGGDTLDGGAGNDVLDGGGDRDTVSYATSPSGVDLDLRTGTATGNGTDTLRGTENATGSPQADRLTGDAAANTLSGGGGDDTLAGSAGDDSLSGGTGTDTVTYVYAGAAVNVALSTGRATGDGTDRVSGAENATGSPYDDTLTGSNAANSLEGGGGNDTIVGGDNADRLYGGTGDDDLNGGAGNDFLDAGIGLNECAGGGGSDTLLSNCHDSTGPTLTGLSFDKTSIDTATAEQTVTLTLHVSDDLSGIDHGHSYFNGPPTSPSATGVQNFQLIAGDELDGTYTATVTIPQYAAAGTYTIGILNLFDRAGNNHSYSPADLEALGFPTSFDQTGPGDTTGPTLTGLSFDKTSIDTATAEQTVTLTLHVSDDLSGIDHGHSYFNGPPTSPSATGVQNFQLIAGDELDGTYTATVTIPQYAAAGTYTIGILNLFDRAGNNHSYSPADLEALGFPTSFDQTGPGDTTGPTLTGLSFDKTSIDTATAEQTVTLTLHVSDDLSGIDHGHSYFNGPPTSPSATGVQNFQLIAGDELDGAYTATVTIPQYAAAGTYTIGILNLFDRAGNNHSYSPADLEALGFPTTIQNG